MLTGQTTPEPDAKALILDPFITNNGLEESFSDPLCGTQLSWKTLMSKSSTATNTFTAGVANCVKGGGFLSSHCHAHAELYYFTEGSGLVEINGVRSAVQSGSLVFIPANAQHWVSNISETSDLKWLFIFATDDFSDVIYQWKHLSS